MKSILKKITLGIFALGTVATLSAQKVDAKAKNILDAVSSNYKSKNNVYFKFVYGTGTGTNVTKTETGIFYSAKDKYKLKIMGTEQIFDGSKVYNISSEDMEVTIAKARGDEQMFSPMNYINEYKNGYNVQYLGKKSVNGVNADYIKMIPTTKNGIKEVNLFVNSAKKQLVKLEQFASDNSVAVIAVNQYKENQNLAANTFTFNKNLYKDYLITEL